MALWSFFSAVEVVSIHAPARGATRLRMPVNTSAKCFNPRPCVKGDGLVYDLHVCIGVSIHAPAWGTTRHTNYKTGDLNDFRGRVHPIAVSIHAPMRGRRSKP